MWQQFVDLMSQVLCSVLSSRSQSWYLLQICNEVGHQYYLPLLACSIACRELDGVTAALRTNACMSSHSGSCKGQRSIITAAFGLVSVFPKVWRAELYQWASAPCSRASHSAQAQILVLHTWQPVAGWCAAIEKQSCTQMTALKGPLISTLCTAQGAGVCIPCPCNRVAGFRVLKAVQGCADACSALTSAC